MFFYSVSHKSVVWTSDNRRILWSRILGDRKLTCLPINMSFWFRSIWSSNLPVFSRSVGNSEDETSCGDHNRSQTSASFPPQVLVRSVTGLGPDWRCIGGATQSTLHTNIHLWQAGCRCIPHTYTVYRIVSHLQWSWCFITISLKHRFMSQELW